MVHRELVLHIGQDVIYIEGGGEVLTIDRQTGVIQENPSQVIPTQPTVIRALGLFGMIKLPGKLVPYILLKIQKIGVKN